MILFLPVIWISLIFTLSSPDPITGELKKMRDQDKNDLHWKDTPAEG
jgi:hypothetical protein